MFSKTIIEFYTPHQKCMRAPHSWMYPFSKNFTCVSECEVVFHDSLICISLMTHLCRKLTCADQLFVELFDSVYIFSNILFFICLIIIDRNIISLFVYHEYFLNTLITSRILYNRILKVFYIYNSIICK